LAELKANHGLRNGDTLDIKVIFKIEPILSASLYYIAKNFMKFQNLASCFSLTSEFVAAILSSSSLSVDKEDTILSFISEWQ